MKKTVKKQKACRWHVCKKVFRINMSTWHIRTFTGISSNVLWLVPYNFVSTSAQILNNVNQKVGISAKTNWSCFHKIKHHRKIHHLHYLKIDISRQLNFNSYLLSVIDINTSFHIHNKTNISRKLFYKNYIMIRQTTQWKNYENPITKSSNWFIRKIIGLSSSANWNTIHCSSCSASTIWNVGHIGIISSASWNTIGAVKKTADIVFDTRLTTAKKHATRWNQYRTLWFQRFVRYKISKRVLSYIVPKSVHQPGKLRGAYVPNTTIAVLDKKRRFKLGIK